MQTSASGTPSGVFGPTFDRRYLPAHRVGKAGDLHSPLIRASDARNRDDRVTTDHGAGNVVRALRAAKGNRSVDNRHKQLRKTCLVKSCLTDLEEQFSGSCWEALNISPLDSGGCSKQNTPLTSAQRCYCSGFAGTLISCSARTWNRRKLVYSAVPMNSSVPLTGISSRKRTGTSIRSAVLNPNSVVVTRTLEPEPAVSSVLIHAAGLLHNECLSAKRDQRHTCGRDLGEAQFDHVCASTAINPAWDAPPSR